MNKKKSYSWSVGPSHDQMSIDLFICEHLKKDAHIEISRKKLKSLIDQKIIQLSVNKKNVSKASTKVVRQDNVSALIPIALLKELTRNIEIKDKINLTIDHIIWEDQKLLIASKPKGLPSLQTLDPKRDYFLAAIKRLLVQRDGRENYLALHHRLDVETSGLMLFCKKKSLNKDIGELFSKRKIHKEYHALCSYHSLPQNLSWEIKNYLKQIDKRSLKRSSVKSGGDFSHSSFSVIKTNESEKTILIKAIPHTGRTHQLRVHLSEFGLPIIADRVYGKSLDNVALQLHCKKLSFTHPVTHEIIEVTDRY